MFDTKLEPLKPCPACKGPILLVYDGGTTSIKFEHKYKYRKSHDCLSMIYVLNCDTPFSLIVDAWNRAVNEREALGF